MILVSVYNQHQNRYLEDDDGFLEFQAHKCKGLFKRMEHVGPTSSNIVVSNMLGPFEHHVGYCIVCCYSECISHTRQAEKSA